VANTPRIGLRSYHFDPAGKRVDHTDALLTLRTSRSFSFGFTEEGRRMGIGLEEAHDGTFRGRLSYFDDPWGHHDLVASVRTVGGRTAEERRWQLDVSEESVRGHGRWAVTIHAAQGYDLPCSNLACNRGLVGDDVCPVCKGSGEAPEREPSPRRNRPESGPKT
jgi:hypothetical protein